MTRKSPVISSGVGSVAQKVISSGEPGYIFLWAGSTGANAHLLGSVVNSALPGPDGPL